ncbi:MAG: ECF transporter S component, partial [Clostridia bacterium]|nr:ECF transporter S component [Clostridia bacterium]
VLVFTPIGMILLPPPLPAVTMVHIPVILAVLVEGPLVGLAVGLVFGVCSLIRAWESGMVGLTLFFRNPLVSVLPRLLIPLVALGIYILWQKAFKTRRLMDRIGAGVAAVFGALTNTVCCLGMILLLYGQELNELLNGMLTKGEISEVYANHAAGWLVAVVGLPNGIAEAAVAAILIPILKTAVDALGKRAGRNVSATAHKGREL